MTATRMQRDVSGSVTTTNGAVADLVAMPIPSGSTCIVHAYVPFKSGMLGGGSVTLLGTFRNTGSPVVQAQTPDGGAQRPMSAHEIFERAFANENNGGMVVQIGATVTLASMMDAALASAGVALVVSGSKVILQVTGIASAAMDWSGYLMRYDC